GAWRWVYVVTAVVALWFNCFVGVVQAFQKISVLQPLAPTQSEPPFQIAQGVLLAIFLVLGILAVRRVRPALCQPLTPWSPFRWLVIEFAFPQCFPYFRSSRGTDT